MIFSNVLFLFLWRVNLFDELTSLFDELTMSFDEFTEVAGHLIVFDEITRVFDTGISIVIKINKDV